MQLPCFVRLVFILVKEQWSPGLFDWGNRHLAKHTSMRSSLMRLGFPSDATEGTPSSRPCWWLSSPPLQGKIRNVNECGRTPPSWMNGSALYELLLHPSSSSMQCLQLSYACCFVGSVVLKPRVQWVSVEISSYPSTLSSKPSNLWTSQINVCTLSNALKRKCLSERFPAFVNVNVSVNVNPYKVNR